MKKTFTLFISIILSCAGLWAQQTIYVIDNVTVENFDGSQLKGKTVKDYQITTTGKGSKAITVHAITTTLPVFSISGEFPKPKINFNKDFSIPDSLLNSVRIHADTLAIGRSKILYIIDGEVTADEAVLRSLNADRISNVTVIRDKSALSKFGVPYPIITITTKDKPQTDISEILKKLPGVVIGEDGRVTANGEPIRRIIINGGTKN